MDIAIEASHISKVFKLYNKPIDRLKESLNPSKKKYHNEFYALKDVSFQIQKGDAVGILGKNGSGKSTLLKLLTRVQSPSSGDICINGRISALLELGAGFNGEYTGEENIYLNGEIMGYTRSRMAARISQIIEFADIGDFVYQPVKTYSSGMFLRLAFAVAIHVDPDILIIDEALAVGDTRFQMKCMDKIMEFIDSGKTVIFVSHDINSIKRLCKRAIWLNEGELMLDGVVDLVSDSYFDYLKLLDSGQVTKEVYGVNVANNINIENKLKGIDIAEINALEIYNINNELIEDVNHGESIIMEVSYLVNDILIESPVLGIAIFSLDHKYICGLNTLLDKKRIPWVRGLNKFRLKFKSFNLTGGSYYCDVALFDRTATVPIDYKKSYKTFFVYMDYIAEGIVVLEHEWRR